jgi:hypothetical protein
MIFLNLFLAILLENFEEGDDEDEDEGQVSESFVAKFITQLKMRTSAMFSKCLGNNKTTEETPNEPNLESPI